MQEITLTLAQEAELVRRSQTDAQAFAALYEHYFPRVYRYVYFRVVDRATTDDLVSTIFLRVLERIGNYQEKRGEFSLWLFRIAHNAVVDHYRKNTRQTVVALEETNPELIDAAPLDQDVLRRIEAGEILTQVARLADREREIIGLKFGAGFGNKEIAMLVKLTENHVAVILYRAMNKLRQGLAEVSG
jgi:RNA polymerase sigma-70 factor (ECF subfamily)